MNNLERKEYWENYITYWNNKVDEANSNENKVKDKAPSDDTANQYIDLLAVKKEEKFLDYGCGSCRIYPYVREHSNHYYGVDIAKSPLEYATQLYSELEGYLRVTNDDEIPFEENSFNKIFCFGVFDACIQEKAIYEIIRVLDINGEALVTGKNTNYYLDDDLACVAEINARKKGHPNYFTDVELLIKELKERGIRIIELRYFERRGDFAKNTYLNKKPQYFYEFAIIIKKTVETEIVQFDKFSNDYSKTFLRKECE